MALSVHRPSKIYSYILQAIWGSLDKPNLRVADRSVEYKVHVRDKWQPSVSPSVRFTRCWETEAKWQELTNLIWRWKRTFVTQYTYIYSLYFCWLRVFCMETYIYPFARVSQNGFFPLIAPVLTPLASFLVPPQISIRSLPSWEIMSSDTLCLSRGYLPMLYWMILSLCSASASHEACVNKQYKAVRGFLFCIYAIIVYISAE